jgi:hypothetical protein
LYVEDAAVGGDRTSEVRVRVISDSPLLSLALRSLLHTTPLYDPEVFPRTITVYAATQGSSEKPYTAVDVDTAGAKAVVLSVGNVSLADLTKAIATAAATLQHAGGYRHVPGGSQNPNIREARAGMLQSCTHTPHSSNSMYDIHADGILDWYVRDGHYYAPASEAPVDLLSLSDATVVTSGGTTALVLGSTGAVAAAAAAKGRLFASQGAVWHSAGLSALWAGLSVPTSVFEANKAAFASASGYVNAFGSVTIPLKASRTVVSPSKIILVNAAGGTNLPVGLSNNAVPKWQSRVSSIAGGVTAVQSEKDALKALEL